MHVERERAPRDRAADAAEPHERERAPGHGVERGPREVPVPGRLVQPRLRHALGPREHGRHHPLRDRLRARAPRAGDDPAVEDRARHLVDAGTRRLHPAHTGRVDPARDLVPREVAAEEHVGREPGRRITAGELDHLDVGQRAAAICAAAPGPIWLITRRPTSGEPTRASYPRWQTLAHEVRSGHRRRHSVLRRTGVVRRRHARGHERRRRRALPRVARAEPRRGVRARPTAERTAPRSRPTARSSSPRTAASTSRTSPACSASCRSRSRPLPGSSSRAPTARSPISPTEGLNGPNDLAVAPNGDVYFTDPGHYPPPDGELVGRVMIYERDGTLRTFAGSFHFCNGIAFEPDGTSSWSSGAACSGCTPTAAASG